MAPTLLEPPPVMPAPACLTVLIVEDCPDTADTMAQLLDLWGYASEWAATGRAALESLAARPADVVLLDLGLPDVAGLDVARRIVRDRRGVRPLVIAMTGSGGAESARRSREAGVDLHLVKPADPDALRGVLGRFARVLG